MNILLTGKPGSGKTTLLAGFVEAVSDKQGFLAWETRKDGERTGFELVSADGTTAILASIYSKGSIKVSRYRVNIEELDEFLEALPALRPTSLLYIDEIGQMELFSERFKSLVKEFLNSDNTFIGTITSVHQDEFTEEVLTRDDLVLLEVAAETRNAIGEALKGLAANLHLLDKLPAEIQRRFTNMARSYAKDGHYTQLIKLFKNALKYLAENRVRAEGDDCFLVKGNTSNHRLIKNDYGWQCDCDLFLGRGKYAGRAGECSHVQAIKLSGPTSKQSATER